MPEARRPLFGRFRVGLFFRVVAIYAGASWAVLEIVDVFGEQFGLPTWFFPTAVGLLLIGLPIILATSIIQAELQAQTQPLPAADPAQEPETSPAVARPKSQHPLLEWFTWRRAILGGVLAFTALGLVGTIVVLRGSARVTEAYGAAGDEFGERAWLVVADFEAPADEADLADAVREALTVDLQQSKYVNVYTGAQMAGVLRRMELPDTVQVGSDLAREIAQRQGLAATLSGQISRIGDSYGLSARVLRPSDGDELVAVRTTAGRERLVDAVEALSREVRLRLGETRAAIGGSQPLPEVTTRSLDALRRYSQAVAALAHGDQEQAIDLAEAAIDLDPEFAMAYRLAGVAHGNLGRFSERERYLREAYDRRDKLSERERLHIEAYTASDVFSDPLEAIAKYELILSSYPDDGRAANNLAATAYDVRDYDRQFSSAMRAVELNPYTWTGYSNAIGAARRLDRWAVAESLAHLAGERGLEDRALRWLWTQNVAQGNWPRADAVCDSLLTHTSPTGGYRAGDEASCGYLDIARGRIARATDRIGRAAELRRERGQSLAYYSANGYLVHASLLRNRQPEARRWLERALAEHPLDSIGRTDRLIANWWAGYMATQLGDLAAAGHYSNAITADTTVYWEAAWSHRLDAFISLSKGDYPEALEQNRRGVERDFGTPILFDHFLRAQVFDGLGQRDSAIAFYERMVAPRTIGLGPGAQTLFVSHLPVVHRRLGELYDQAGDAAKAAKHYETFIELWSGCDVELRPQVESARRALGRLATELGSTSGTGSD